jgi:hypothetical protein
LKKIASYRHKIETAAQEPDTQPGYYYVSVIDGTRFGLLLGPFENDHVKALNMVEAVRKKAEELDPWGAFYGFGTCRVPLDTQDPPEGRLNDLFSGHQLILPFG